MSRGFGFVPRYLRQPDERDLPQAKRPGASMADLASLFPRLDDPGNGNLPSPMPLHLKEAGSQGQDNGSMSFGFGFTPQSDDLAGLRKMNPGLFAGLLSQGAQQNASPVATGILGADLPDARQGTLTGGSADGAAVPLPPTRPAMGILAQGLQDSPSGNGVLGVKLPDDTTTAYASMPGPDTPMPPRRPVEFGGIAAPSDTRSEEQTVGANVSASPQPGQPSFMDRVWRGIGDNSDGLLAFGSGLMSAPNWGQGVAKGIEGMQRADALRTTKALAQQKLLLEQQKVAQVQQGQNATYKWLVGKGLDPNDATTAIASSMAGNKELLQGYLNKYSGKADNQIVQGPNGYVGAVDRNNPTAGVTELKPPDASEKAAKDPEAIRKLQWAQENWQQARMPDPASTAPADVKRWDDFSSNMLSGKGQTINFDRGENAEASTLGTGRGKRADELEGSASNAPNQLARLNLLGALMEKATTGKFGPGEASVVGWAQAAGLSDERIKALGLNPNQAITAEASQKIINELTVGSIGKGGFPANNFSDADRDFLTKIFPSMANRPEANAIALDVMKRVEQRKIDAGQAWGDYQDQQRQQGKNPEFSAWERQHRKQVQGENLFGDLQKQIGSLSNGNPAQVGASAQAGVSAGLPPIDPGQSRLIGNATVRRVR